ncbi:MULTISPECIES: hypothetical protein [Nitratiruptor]|uniref:Predicted metal-binding, possibly nucleic acid-binding protein n=1 Tax=Nitratiruptor tergarcus DSM 16512 TaxID=1069081 RepID=A0A1W1WSP8_9BACT|nr:MULTISPECIES: hypothetical protein [Nitratiruptor]BCD61581.1 hypothetical protein NitYY0813_C0435 [Nitratiruptor sp. YY08-13]BCD65515.1 hypothetical protein NitYY0826_C0436 [Nitratiruptor sp. YY08-26]SMC09070.1 Predicted metal-binding, possibly nucleic acid-binding protein [Nitratiruptor tergarcus DSM 16512]
MRIAFKKIGFSKKDVEVTKDTLTLRGKLEKKKELVDFLGVLQGKQEVECSRCGENFFVTIDEEIFLKFSDGIYEGFDEEADVIEFYDGSIDLDEVINAESESIKLDYHICKKCIQQTEGEENGST